MLLAFLAVGVLFGEDGPGGIVFNDMSLSYSVCSLALAIILFDGGIHTPLKNFKQSLGPALLLATLGVLVTTGVVAVGVLYFLDVGVFQALLYGAIVGSTDAAAVFLLLRQRGILLKPHMSSTLEVESGINDPMAIFLTLIFVQLLLLQDGELNTFEIGGEFVRQAGIGAALGYAGGRILIWLCDRLELASGLYPIFALAGSLLLFGSTNLLGGSGFLAVYLAGLRLGNHDYKTKQLVRQFMDGLAWLSQLGMLLILGLLVTPSKLIQDIPTAMIIAGVLIFLARPVAVFICLIFNDFTWREKLFISWVGLRGAIPIYLAIIPVMFGLEGDYFNIAFIIVFCSLFLQGWTVRIAAKILAVEQKEPI